MKRTGATGPHFHIGLDSGLASSYAKRMNYKYNPKVVPNYTMPIPGNHIGPALPPVKNNIVPDKDLLAQSETIDQQNEKVAELDSRWQTLLQQEADAAKAEAEAKLKAEKDRQRAFGLNLAMGIINNMGAGNQQTQGTYAQNFLTPFINNLHSLNTAAYGGPIVRIANRFDDGGKYYYKSKDAGYIMPEIAVTPNGNYAAAPLGNGDYGVTAGTLNYMGVPIYREGNELKSNQYNTLQPQWMVDQNADEYAERTSLGIGDLLNAGIVKPLELINPLNLLASCSSNKNTETDIKESDSPDHLSEHYTEIINPSDKQIEDHWDDVLNGKAYYQGVNINDKNIPTRLVFRRPNESRTAPKSQELENMMYTALDEYRNRVNYRTLPFDIPYGVREIT